MSGITVVQLYPDELGVAGDRGNVLAVTSRLTEAAVDYTVVEVNRGDALPPSADMVFVGGGPVSAMRRVHSELLGHGAVLRKWAGDGVVFFAYGSGAEMLATSVNMLDSDVMEGVGIFPFTARRVDTRHVGYVVAEASGTRVVGFEDNATQWIPAADSLPFAHVTTSSAAASTGGSPMREGVLVGASIATLLGGPLLPLNPAITLGLIGAATERRGIDFIRPAAGDLDRYAERARAIMEQNATHVFSRI